MKELENATSEMKMLGTRRTWNYLNDNFGQYILKSQKHNIFANLDATLKSWLANEIDSETDLVQELEFCLSSYLDANEAGLVCTKVADFIYDQTILAD